MPTAQLHKGKILVQTSALRMARNCIRWWDSCPGDLSNVERHFIDIIHRSTLFWTVYASKGATYPSYSSRQSFTKKYLLLIFVINIISSYLKPYNDVKTIYIGMNRITRVKLQYLQLFNSFQIKLAILVEGDPHQRLLFH